MAIVYNQATGAYEDDQSGDNTPINPVIDRPQDPPTGVGAYDPREGLRRIMAAFASYGAIPTWQDIQSWGQNPTKEQVDDALFNVQLTYGQGSRPPDAGTNNGTVTPTTGGTTPTTGTGTTRFTGGMAEFQNLFGSPRTPAELTALESRLNAAGIFIRRNAAGVAGKIQLPDGSIVDVIEAADAGGRGFQWLTGPGGGGTNTTTTGGGTTPTIDPSYLAPFTQTFKPPDGATQPVVPGASHFDYAGYQGPKDFSYEGYQAPDPFSYEGYNAPDPFVSAPFQGGPAFQAPTGESILQDPSYQFRRDQGVDALQNSASARGLINSRGTLADVLKYGQNFASQEYGNIYDRSLNAWSQNYNQARDTYGLNQQGALNAYQTNAQTGLNAYNSNRANAFENSQANAANGLNSYNANRANALDAFQTNASVGLSGYNANRANALDSFNANQSATNTRFTQQQQASQTAYDRAWQSFLNDEETWYRNQSEPFDKIFRLSSLGAGLT